MEPALARLAEQIRTAAAARSRLCIRAGGSKDFYGNLPSGAVLDPREWRGIVDYQPSELVITARAGTPLAELETALAERGQILAFEPPHFASTATVGGCVAAGLAGPRRAAAGTAYGSVRDALLGVRVLDGRGELLRFGGTVIKNVAGYDASRVFAGSLGALGLLTEVSLKVLPRPALECTLRWPMGAGEALRLLRRWAGQPWPVSASLWVDGTLAVRVAGAAAAVQATRAALGGELVGEAAALALWQSLREQTHEFFTAPGALWRLSLPAATPPLTRAEPMLIEWGGAQRWLHSPAPATELRRAAAQLGGHATLFRSADAGTPRRDAFTPLAPAQLALQQRVRAVFDPAGVFDAGRLYPEL